MDRFIFNNYTTNNGVATAYDAIKSALCEFAYEQYVNYPDLFSEPAIRVGSVGRWKQCFLSEVKDFHTSGKVSATLGIPLLNLPAQTFYTMPTGEEVQVVRARYEEARDHVAELVDCF